MAYTIKLFHSKDIYIAGLSYRSASYILHSEAQHELNLVSKVGMHRTHSIHYLTPVLRKWVLSKYGGKKYNIYAAIVEIK